MSFRVAWVGVDHPHGAGWRETFAQVGEDVEVTAVVPGFGGALASLEERFAETPRFDSVADLLSGGAKSFDGAVICFPNDVGPDCVRQLAEAGKHVLVEKPMAASAGDAEPALAAVEAAGVAFQSGYMWRYDETVQRLRRMVADGQFGRLISIEMTFVTSDVKRRGADHYLFQPGVSGGGFFNWLACHYLDLLHYVTGDMPAAVTARTGVFGGVPIEVEDGGVALMELSQGGLATFLGGYWLPRWAGEARWCVRGTERWVHWLPGVGGGRLEIHGPQPQWHAMEDEWEAPADDTPGYGGRNGVALIRDWLEAAATGAPCRNTPESTRRTLRLLDAIAESSRLQRRVEA